MSKKAVVQGEWHIFATDRKSLMDRDTEQYQALYCEGRSGTITPHPLRIRYNLYVIGILTLKICYLFVGYLYSKIPVSSGYEIGKEARCEDLYFDDTIDLETREIFDSYSLRTVNLTLGILLTTFVLQFLYTFIADTFSIGVPGIFTVTTSIPIWILTLLLGMFLPFVYSSLLISYANTGARDEKMANTITERCNERDHDSVLVLVGDKHVCPLTEELEKHGWEVDPHRSNSLPARIHQHLEFE